MPTGLALRGAHETDPKVADRGFAHPEKLVSTDWLIERLDDPSIVVVESNEDPLLYSQGHIPNAHEVDWVRDLNDPLKRDYIDARAFADLLARLGVDEETTVVFYGDKNNWWATYSLWVFELFGVTNTVLLDGGRTKWLAENRPITRELPRAEPTPARTFVRDDRTVRAFREDVLKHLAAHPARGEGRMVDVRSPEEFDGTRTHMESYPNEGALRGGHIPNAANVPWAKAVNPETGEYKPAADLAGLYEPALGEDRDPQAIVYCRIGERSSHTWFAAKYLLGYKDVKNYDGSWTEWGNLVGVPIER